MLNTIDWLIKMESGAREFYSKASRHFSADFAFSEFLSNLSHDESIHLDEIVRIGELVKKLALPAPLLKVNEDIQQEHLRPFVEATAKLAADKLTKQDVLDLIVKLEFSEWNDVFIYVMNEAKAKMRSFIPSAVNLQNHKNYIKRYVEKQPDCETLMKQLSSAPTFWEEKILVVDDFPHIRQLLKSVLTNHGAVETAGSGDEAIKKVDDQYYAVIVSDVGMDGMNGMEFYRQAVARYPRLKSCFLFFTSNDDAELIRFAKENELPYLIKPAGINEIRAAVSELISKYNK